MKITKKHLILLIIAVALLALGFYRDFVFKSINALLQAWDHDMDYSMPQGLRFFEDLEYDTIVNIKWLLTILFSLLYLTITLFTLKLLYAGRETLKIAVGSYTGVLVISAVFIFMGLIFKNSSEKMYEFARYLMGIAQSPIILMILIPVFKLSEKEKQEVNKK